MNQTDILPYIPQRPPFVMIDTLLYADERISKTSFTIKEENVLVENGFFSEAGLVENIAQTAAAGKGYRVQEDGKPAQGGFIGALKNLSVYALPRVGDTIITETNFITQVMNAHIVQGKIILENREIANCELKIFLQES